MRVLSAWNANLGRKSVKRSKSDAVDVALLCAFRYLHIVRFDLMRRIIAYIVAEPCVNCKYTDCVDVCPVDCFYEGVNFLAIHPEDCIDCGACEPECPTEAIFEEDDLPEKWRPYIELNAQYADEWPNITAKKDAMPDADKWKEVEEKTAKLSSDPGAG